MPCSYKKGSILMETLLVIPLFTVLIGGMAWIAEIEMTRHKLLVSDRIAAWTVGNRHAASGQKQGGALRNRLQLELFDALRGQAIQPAAVSRPSSALWGGAFAGGVRANQAVPFWARGFLQVDHQGDRGAAVQFNAFSGLQAREVQSNRDAAPDRASYEGHAVLMRTGDDVARQYVLQKPNGQEYGTRWRDAFLEWGPEE